MLEFKIFPTIHESLTTVGLQARYGVDIYLCDCFVVKRPSVEKGSVHVKDDMCDLSGTFSTLLLINMVT